MAKLPDILASVRRSAADLLRGPAGGLSRPAGEPFEPFAFGDLTGQCHVTWPTDARLLDAWDALSRVLPAATPLHSPTWQAAAFAASKATALRLITISRADQLLAVVPMQLSAAGGLGAIGFWMTDYLDPLASDAAVWPAVLAFLEAHWDRRVNEVVFHNLREHAAIRRELPAIAGGFPFEVREEVIDAAPAIDLPATWDAYLATLDAHDRKETRRKLNKAETRGGATLTRASADVLPAAIDLIEAGGGEKAENVREYLRPLLLAAGPSLMAEGRLELLVLRIEGKPAACLLQFPTPAGPMLYNTGHDPAAREWSPGAVAVAMAIRDAIAHGAKTYDLLRGREPYKYRLGAVDRPLYRLTLRRKVDSKQ